MTHKTSFTLIELLVVMAIIAVLVSILLPSLASARDFAKLAVCGANMKQQHMGYVSYMVEWNDYLPGAECWYQFDIFTYDKDHDRCRSLPNYLGGYDMPEKSFYSDLNYFGISDNEWGTELGNAPGTVLDCPSIGRGDPYTILADEVNTTCKSIYDYAVDMYPYPDPTPGDDSDDWKLNFFLWSIKPLERMARSAGSPSLQMMSMDTSPNARAIVFYGSWSYSYPRRDRNTKYMVPHRMHNNVLYWDGHVQPHEWEYLVNLGGTYPLGAYHPFWFQEIQGQP